MKYLSAIVLKIRCIIFFFQIKHEPRKYNHNIMLTHIEENSVPDLVDPFFVQPVFVLLFSSNPFRPFLT